MTEEKQIYLLKLLKDMINKYKSSTNLQEKEEYLSSINNFGSSFEYALSSVHEEFLYRIYELISIEGIDTYLSEFNKEQDLRYRRVYNKSYNYDYLKYLINNIDISTEEHTKYVFATNDWCIKDYLKESEYLLFKYQQDNQSVIIDDNFLNSCSITLYNNLNIILMNKLDIPTLFHEFLHGIYLNTITIYRETPNILGELALRKQYCLNSTIDRLEVLKIAKKLNSTIFSNKYYLIGTILSHAIINKYGSDFKTINYFMNLISKNDQIDLKSMLQLCNISEQDIFASFNKSKSYVYER